MYVRKWTREGSVAQGVRQVVVGALPRMKQPHPQVEIVCGGLKDVQPGLLPGGIDPEYPVRSESALDT